MVKQQSEEALNLLESYCRLDQSKCLFYWFGISLLIAHRYLMGVECLNELPVNHKYYQTAMIECANVYLLGKMNADIARLYFEKGGVELDKTYLTAMLPTSEDDSFDSQELDSDDSSSMVKFNTKGPKIEVEEFERVYNHYLRSYQKQSMHSADELSIATEIFDRVKSPIFSAEGKFRELQKFVQAPANFNHAFRAKLVKHYGGEFFNPKDEQNERNDFSPPKNKR